MSTAAHTPGPWVGFASHEELGGGPFDILPAGRPGIIAMEIKNLADARLIAAAPDLLAACIDLTDQLALLAVDPRENLWVKQGRDAIAKAEGRS